MKKNIIILGSGGHSKSIIELITSNNEWNICGLVGFKNEINQKVLGYKVIGCDEDLISLREEYEYCFNAIGQIKSSDRRFSLTCKLMALNFKLPTIIASSAVISRFSRIGNGTSVGHGAVINAETLIGNNCIINSKVLIEHDSKIGDFCHISTGALINGGVKIGEHSFIGSGAIIRENIELPRGTIIGAGETIKHWPTIQNNR